MNPILDIPLYLHYNKGWKRTFTRWLGHTWSLFSQSLTFLIEKISGVAFHSFPHEIIPDENLVNNPLIQRIQTPPLTANNSPTQEDPEEDEWGLANLFNEEKQPTAVNTVNKEEAPLANAKGPSKTSFRDGVRQLRRKILQAHPTKVPSHPKMPQTNQSPLVWSENEPLQLDNVGNSCYLGSTLQALLCVQSILESIRTPLSMNQLSNSEFSKAQIIQKELLPFISPLTQSVSVHDQLKNLREAIFKSQIQADLKSGKYQQKDAAAPMELLLQLFIPSELEIQEQTAPEVFPGMIFLSPVQKITMLHLPLQNNFKNLVDLLHADLADPPKSEARTFDPKDGILTDQEKKDLFVNQPPQPSTFSRHFQLLNSPPTITLHLKRFDKRKKCVGKKEIIQLSKIHREICLPEDGSIDLSKYCKNKLQALYRIKSFVTHQGELHGGHYVSYVEKNGRYFLCNDLDAPEYYHEISKEEFFGHKDAYLIVMERINP